MPSMSPSKLRRLRPIGPAELVFRGRQELSKRLERIGVIGSPRSWSILGTLSPAEVVDRFRVAAPARFFEGAVSGQTRTLLESRMPEARKRIVAGGRADLPRGLRHLGGTA